MPGVHLSFCGCGFLGMYHMGVAASLLHRGRPLMAHVSRVAGASAGALVAALVVTAGDKVDTSASYLHVLAKEIRHKPLGALTPGYTFTKTLRNMMEEVLPEDAHYQASGVLHVSLTNINTRQNELMSDFRSREELIEALIASCYIPMYAGVQLPTLRGKKYMDGGLTDNLPQFEDGRTITISPFDGKSDIHPKRKTELKKKAHFITLHNQKLEISMKNIKRGGDAFFPPRPSLLQHYFVQGQDDANRFLIKERLFEDERECQI